MITSIIHLLHSLNGHAIAITEIDYVAELFSSDNSVLNILITCSKGSMQMTFLSHEGTNREYHTLFKDLLHYVFRTELLARHR